MEGSFKRPAVIGLGLMGGSLALSLKGIKGIESVSGFDISQEVREKAKELGACGRVCETLSDAVSGCDLVFLAVPVRSIVKVFEEIVEFLAEGTLVTDLGSVKLPVVQAIEKIVPSSIDYIGGHPMTGSEQSGIESARNDLYKDCYYILTPTEKTDSDAFARLHSFLTDMGSRVISMDAKTHDEAMAIISHVPHLLSLILMEIATNEREKIQSLFRIAGGGFRDMTRIAASNPDTWADICIENRKFIVEGLRLYKEETEKMIKILENSEDLKLKELFASARKSRAEMSLKKMEIEELFEVRLPVPDKPGILSKVSTAVGSLGINIEDIAIIHPLEGETGILTLKILGEENARNALEHLKSLGFKPVMRKV